MHKCNEFKHKLLEFMHKFRNDNHLSRVKVCDNRR